MNLMLMHIPHRKPGRRSKWEFKKPRILAQLEDPALTIRGVAKAEGVPESTVRNWIRAHRKEEA